MAITENILHKTKCVGGIGGKVIQIKDDRDKCCCSGKKKTKIVKCGRVSSTNFVPELLLMKAAKLSQSHRLSDAI